MPSLRPGSTHRSPKQRVVRMILPQASVFRTFLKGIVGGFIATIVMTLYRFPLFRALPPTAEFWATFVRPGEPEQYPVAGLVLHLLYGCGAGSLFAIAFSRLEFRSERDRRLSAITLSALYGAVLSVFGTRVILKRMLRKELEPDEAAVFHVAHIIYGLTLGTWLSQREQSGDVYE